MINGVNGASVASAAYATQTKLSNDSQTHAKETDKSPAKSGLNAVSQITKTHEYGKTIGEPKLSEKAQKYYDSLKKKFGNYDFVLVSEDQKANAQANAAMYANKFKTVVLIDEAKIEKMASDEKYRQQYEGILSGASSQLEQIKSQITSSGANVKGFGMQVNDNGTTSFFAVLKKSSADQKARIEKHLAQKKAEKRAEEKKARKEAQEERLHKSDRNKADYDMDEDDEDTITITADSIEELMSKLSEYSFNERSNNVLTEEEMQVGQHIDFKG